MVLKLNINSLHLKFMQRVSHSHKNINTKRNFQLKSIDSSKKNTKYQNKPLENKKRVPLIIKQIEQSLQQLKACYQEQLSKSYKSSRTITIRKTNRPQSLNNRNKIVSHEEQTVDESNTAVVPELDDLKKSFINAYGYDSNNIVELYNFYKKNAQKSTKLFASTSMSNMINLTQNHSELRQRSKLAHALLTEDNYKQKLNKQNKQTLNILQGQRKLPFIKTQNILRKTNEMVNVATLLANKQKISRRNIIENINSQNLLNQAHKKLYRLNPNDNLEKINKIKQNFNFKQQQTAIRNVSNKKIHLLKEKSNEKKKINIENKNKQNQIVTKCFLSTQKKQQNKQILDRSLQLSKIQEFKGQISAFQLETGGKSNNKQKLSHNKQDKKQISHKKSLQYKEEKSAKSCKSLKQIKSPYSIKTPSLNQGVIMDLTDNESQDSKKRMKGVGSYFVPKIHSNLHDSLLDCEITAKEQSKLLDLESIPFDF